LPVIAAEYGIGVALAGFMVSAFALPYGMFQLPFGPLGDRFGKLRVMALALGLFALAHLGFAVVQAYWLVVALRFITGAAAAAIISLCLAHIGDTYPYAERQAAMARYMAWVMLGNVLSSAFGGICSDLIGWRGALLVLGAVSVVST